MEYSLLGLLCTFSLFAYSHNMTDTFIVPKWCFTIGILLLSIVVLVIKRWCNKPFLIDVSICSYIIIASCFFQALYGWGQCLKWTFSNAIYGITGSFDNPAGFAASLVAGLPFALQSFKDIKGKILRTGIYLVAFVVIFAIILSGSRSGVMSVVVITGIYGCKYISRKAKAKFMLIIGILCIIMIGAYFLKKNSADGRLLIWRCSWEMFKDAPLLGHGIGSFRAHYMDYQANYFKLHPDSDYAMLADNVVSPFNEYLSLLLNFGLAGLLILFVIILFLLYCYRNNCRYDKQIAMLSLVGIATFSLFSYPFTYPFVWVIVCFDIYVIVRGTFTLIMSMMWRKVLHVLLIIFCIIGAGRLCQRVKAEYEWKKIAYFATDKNLDTYDKLDSILGNDPYFLYNYSVSLFDINHLEESLKVALRCRSYWSDYDLEMLLGNIYKQREEYVLAETHYQKALLMCPCRFIPLYQMLELYQKTNDLQKLHSIAQLIIEKPVKIQSSTVRMIKFKAKKFLSDKSCRSNKNFYVL